MNEDRRTVRRRVAMRGIIEFNLGAHSCAVRNLSEAGALGLPQEFMLIMEIDPRRRHCRVIWRKENRLGVAFE